MNKVVNDYDSASKKAQQYMNDNPQEWDSWLERVEFQYHLFKKYLKELRNA